MKPKIMSVCDLIENHTDFLLIFSTEVNAGIVKDNSKAAILEGNALKFVKQVYGVDYLNIAEESQIEINKEFLNDLSHSIKFPTDVMREYEEALASESVEKVREIFEGGISALNRIVIREAIHDKAQWSFILKLRDATQNIKHIQH